MNLEIRTRERGGTDRCPRCIRDRDGGLGWLPAHTCLDYQTPGQAASRARARRLAQLDRDRQRTR
jgi:hypothetical protein